MTFYKLICILSIGSIVGNGHVIKREAPIPSIQLEYGVPSSLVPIDYKPEIRLPVVLKPSVDEPTIPDKFELPDINLPSFIHKEPSTLGLPQPTVPNYVLPLGLPELPAAPVLPKLPQIEEPESIHEPVKELEKLPIVVSEVSTFPETIPPLIHKEPTVVLPAGLPELPPAPVVPQLPKVEEPVLIHEPVHHTAPVVPQLPKVEEPVLIHEPVPHTIYGPPVQNKLVTVPTIEPVRPVISTLPALPPAPVIAKVQEPVTETPLVPLPSVPEIPELPVEPITIPLPPTPETLPLFPVPQSETLQIPLLTKPITISSLPPVPEALIPLTEAIKHPFVLKPITLPPVPEALIPLTEAIKHPFVPHEVYGVPLAHKKIVYNPTAIQDLIKKTGQPIREVSKQIENHHQAVVKQLQLKHQEIVKLLTPVTDTPTVREPINNVQLVPYPVSVPLPTPNVAVLPTNVEPFIYTPHTVYGVPLNGPGPLLNFN